MNKTYVFFAMLFPMFLASCGKDDASTFQLPADIYTIDKVYDIANSNSAADVRVEVVALSTLQVADLMDVLLLFTKASKTFSFDQIDGLAPGNFFSFPISATKNQVIKPTSFKDADGDAIVNGVPYKVYIVIVGKQGAKQLSASKDFTLANKPIYAGDYVGTWEDLGPPGPGNFPVSLRIADSYASQMFYTPNFVPYGRGTSLQDVTATLVVTGTTFSFVANQFIDKYIGGGAFTTGNTGGCPASKTLTGVVQDDINLVFDTFSWADCDGTRDVKLRFKRQ